MKKIISLVIALAMIACLFAGCNTTPDPTDPSDSEPASTPAGTSDPTPPVEDEVHIWDGYYTNNSLGADLLCFLRFNEDGTYQMKESIDIGLTIDERIADGYYYSKTVRLLRKLLENPELLELPLDEEVDY